MNRINYVNDCKRIQELAISYGYEISLKEAEDLWEEYSGSQCASWLIPYDPKEVKKAIEDYYDKP